ncbi:hypothetical protein NE237_015119 [Protea cynaroides]|uniref:Uncharacterized protein n=1 Tax=Protea cynaroides TaxID=273540 RepID=A0A9Q0KD80_9MAGN|nr:hypothetical protein NE237_015119 [Protea cynaroides]
MGSREYGGVREVLQSWALTNSSSDQFSFSSSQSNSHEASAVSEKSNLDYYSLSKLQHPFPTKTEPTSDGLKYLRFGRGGGWFTIAVHSLTIHTYKLLFCPLILDYFND